MSRDTWDKRDNSEVPLDDVVDWCVSRAEAGADGITISGGEPFEQPAALELLIARLDDWRRTAGRDFDFLCYSGMPLARLQRDFSHILAQLDALIPEPFQRRGPRGGAWQGSSNQPLILLSDLARRRFVDVPNGWQMQVGLSNGKLFTIGIPDRGDMDLLADGLRAKGLKLSGESWLG